MPRTPVVAYFCMEYGLHESFPIYSGGLGVLAGDYIKSARDLGLPMVAIGLRWDRGYGVQRIGPDGQPYEEYPSYESRFLRDTGVRVRVGVRGREVPCVVWVTEHFGHVPLYLLEPQRGEDKWITHRLYEAGTDVRIAQEMLLGIGGIRALNWLGLPVSTYHFNEGHAVFAGIEMIAARMETGMPFDLAWQDVRRHIVFTTHTPVKAGNEEHALKDLRRMGACLQLSGAEMRALGGDPFNMTVAGLRLSRLANAVAQLHGETARAMWSFVQNAAPIIAITNGVHAPTWQSDAVRRAETPEQLWTAHAAHKAELLAEIARRTGHAMDPDALLVGFARRAAAYKRSDLVLRDEKRLAKLLASGRVNFVFSGKSHPDDRTGKGIIARLARASHDHPGKIAFLENYDMALGRLMTRGSDVWLNNPVRPLEASGTSGMKAALNGGLNLSILDGWWPEGCEHGVNGWAIGDATAGDDAKDLEALYHALENEVLPAWADRARWMRMMQAAVRMASERFTTERMIREYFDRLYAPATSPVS
uniref:glycogen phosphorylase n=1 Tax=Eiseniibacteriota bacterium TaxID=2212470 RepID=A0A832MNN9_UNCEI